MEKEQTKFSRWFWLLLPLCFVMVMLFIQIGGCDPVVTPTPTVTSRPKITATFTATPTLTNTATATNTVTPTNTSTPTLTETLTVTPTWHTPTSSPAVGGCNCNQNNEEYYDEYPGCAGRCSWTKDK